MFKFLIIIFLFFFILMRLGGFFLRVLFGRAAQQANQQQSQYRSQNTRKPSDGNVNIDYVPKETKKNAPKNFKGGDYVDFEEVKE